MARYIATSGSHFDPLSYDELVKPLDRLNTAHGAAQDAYDTMALETENIRQYITDNPGDKRALQIYNDYSKKLSDLQNNLWEKGYNASTRQDLSAARTGFANMGKIKKAVENRLERSKEFWDAKHKNPDLVTSADPALGGLDNYLDDDTYGRNWYSYSGTQFMNEVGTDAKARANEMLRNPEVMKDPRLVGYLTRITKEGFTSGEVQNAGDAVKIALAGNRAALNELTDPEKILANILMSHLDSTGAAGKVDASEFNRLFEYGRTGLSQAIGKTNIHDLVDNVWKTNNELYIHGRKKAMDAAAKAAEDADGPHIEDTYTRIVSGPEYQASQERLKKELGPDKLVIAKNGKEVHNAADASDLVYGGDIRRRAYAQLGFDIGRGAGGKLTSTDNFLHGESVGQDGVTYETRYNPRTNTVEAKRKGSNDKYKTSRALTNVYNNAVSAYNNNLDYYKRNDPEVYKMATIDPDKQYKMYDREGLSFDVPLTSYKDRVESNPKNAKSTSVTGTWVARAGTDSGKYLDRAAGLLGMNMSVVPDGANNVKAEKFKDWRAYTGQSGYIHAITPYGTLDEKPVKDINEVFKFDKNSGAIKNLSSMQLDVNSILNNYIILGTTNSNTMYGVGLDMFGSDMLNGAFDQAQQMILGVTANPEYTRQQKQDYINAIVNKTSIQLKNILGYYTNTQSQSGTSKDNVN